MPEETLSRFVEVDGKIWFRTGDEVQIIDSNTGPVLQWMGRIDDQVKVRGVRVELEEVSQAIMDTLGPEKVRRAVVIATSLDDLTMEGGRTKQRLECDEIIVSSKQIVAYLQPAGGGGDTFDSNLLSINELRSILQKNLSPILMPSLVLPIQSLPQTRSGKIDRNALLQILRESIFNMTDANKKGTKMGAGDEAEELDEMIEEEFRGCYKRMRMSSEDLLRSVYSILEHIVLGLDVSASLHRTFFEVGGDSM